MARWPKEQPSTWYSQYKRGSLVSATGRCLLAAQPGSRLCMGLTAAMRRACSRPSGQTAPRHVTARRSIGAHSRHAHDSAFQPGSRRMVFHSVWDMRLAFWAPRATAGGCRGPRPKPAGVGGLSSALPCDRSLTTNARRVLFRTHGHGPSPATARAHGAY